MKAKVRLWFHITSEIYFYLWLITYDKSFGTVERDHLSSHYTSKLSYMWDVTDIKRTNEAQGNTGVIKLHKDQLSRKFKTFLGHVGFPGSKHWPSIH